MFYGNIGHAELYIGNNIFAGFGGTGGSLHNFADAIPNYWKGKRVRIYRFATTYEHSGEWQITKEPTCTQEGQKIRTCIGCGQIENATIPKKEHNYTWEIIKEATCTQEGQKIKTCIDCGEVVETLTIPKMEHSYVHKYRNNIQTAFCKYCNAIADPNKVSTEHDTSSGIIVSISNYYTKKASNYYETFYYCGCHLITKREKINGLYQYTVIAKLDNLNIYNNIIKNIIETPIYLLLEIKK